MEEIETESESGQSVELNSQDGFDHIEVEAIDCDHEASASNTNDDSLEPYADEPLADEEWIQNYRREQEEKRR